MVPGESVLGDIDRYAPRPHPAPTNVVQELAETPRDVVGMSVVPAPADGFALLILSDVLEIAVVSLVRCEALPDNSCSPFRRVMIQTETGPKRYEGRAISNMVVARL